MRQPPQHLTSVLFTGHFRRKANYGQRREGGTDDWLLFYTIGGAGMIRHRFGELVTAPGDLSLIEPRTPHDYHTDPRTRHWHFVWAHFHPRPGWYEWLRMPEVGPGVLNLPVADGKMRERIAERLLECDQHSRGGTARDIGLAMVALEEVLLWCDAVNPNARDAEVDPRVRKACDYCHRNLSGKISLQDIAHACGLSVFRLAHLFRQETGTTLQAFVEQQRMARAQELLQRTAMSVQDVATEVGFASAFYFSNRFRRATGRSPSQFRERSRKSR